MNGQKVIQIQALHDVYGLDLEQGLEQDLNKDSQGQNQVNLAVIEMLRAELEEKNRQLREKDQRITELTDRITEMGKAAQALHAGTMQAQLGPGPDRSQEPEQVITVEDRPAAPAEPERKRHWWPWQRKE